mgnify:CR=1 FL=1
MLYHYRRLRDRVRRELTVSELEEADDLGRTLTVDAILDEYLGRDPD